MRISEKSSTFAALIKIIYNMKHLFLLLLTALLLCSCDPRAMRDLIEDIDELANASVDFTYTVSGRTVTFVNKSSDNISNFQWEFGDGKRYSGYSTQHIYEAAGNYPVTLSGVTNASHKTMHCTKTVQVE